LNRYKLSSYSLKFDADREVHHVELNLERMPDQASFETVREVPWPAQLDIWKLYEQLKAEKAKLIEGKKKMLAWTAKRAREEVERQLGNGSQNGQLSTHS
jgi:hypothetical protein